MIHWRQLGAIPHSQAAALGPGTSPSQMQIAQPCPSPPGFTWANGVFLPLPAGATPNDNAPCGWSPIAFPGLGMQIGPFTFPWTKDTMPGTPTLNPGFPLAPNDPAAAIFSSVVLNDPTSVVCIGEHGDYNGVNGKKCGLWTTVIRNPLQLPIGLQAHLQKILLSDVEGNGHGFGNFWNNAAWLPASGSSTFATLPGVFSTIMPGGNPIVTPSREGQAVTLYQYQQWMAALGIGPDQNYYLNFLPVQGNGLGYAENWYEGLPIAQFDHPNKQLGRWGIWMALESTGGFDAPLVLRIVVDSIEDAKARLPQESIWHQLLSALNPLNWPGMLLQVLEGIGRALEALLGDLVDAAGNLICDLAGNPTVVAATVTAAAASQGIPPAKSAGLVAQAQALAKSQCGGTPTAPPAPTLQPIAPAKPWYLQWYVIAGAALLAGAFLLYEPKPAAKTA